MGEGVPGSEPFGGRFKHVSQGSRPEAGKRLGVLAVDDELESGRHRAPIRLYSAWKHYNNGIWLAVPPHQQIKSPLLRTSIPAGTQREALDPIGARSHSRTHSQDDNLAQTQTAG